MYPNSRYFGLKVVPIWVLWGQTKVSTIWVPGPLGYRQGLGFRAVGFKALGR